MTTTYTGMLEVLREDFAQYEDELQAADTERTILETFGNEELF